METNEKNAHQWWGELSINEQKELIKRHPFFSQMGSYYFSAHKTSVLQMYEMFKNKES
jgi:hypothetical protein